LNVEVKIPIPSAYIPPTGLRVSAAALKSFMKKQDSVWMVVPKCFRVQKAGRSPAAMFDLRALR
jgi:hypothetical protein